MVGCVLVGDKMGIKKGDIKSPQQEVELKFVPHKNNSILLSESYRRLHLINRSDRVAQCGDYLEFHKLHNKPTDGSREWSLNSANFCRDRLCSMCNWRRSLKIFGQVSRIMDLIDKDYKFVFLTLTVKNCYGEDLKKNVDLILKSFNKMSRYKAFNNAFKGYFRTLECTHDVNQYITKKMYDKAQRHYQNQGLFIGDENPNYDMYHPHLHLIMVVKKSYFTSKEYLNQKELSSLWKKALKVSYNPVVHIQKIKENEQSKAVAEVAKYCAKSNEYLVIGNESFTDRIVLNFLHGLSNVRLCSFGGIFKELAKSLELDDVENGDLIHVNGNELRKDVSYIIYKFRWAVGIKNYTLSTEAVYNVQIECDEDYY